MTCNEGWASSGEGALLLGPGDAGGDGECIRTSPFSGEAFSTSAAEVFIFCGVGGVAGILTLSGAGSSVFV